MTKLLAPLLALLLLNPLTLLAEEEPLPPAEAFPMKVTVKDNNTLVTEWNIADGYYLYHNKFSFRTDTEGVTLGEAVIPPGKIKKDPYFGEVETLRGTIRIEIPVTRTDNNTATLNLISRSQGCADMGLCYPPYEQTASVDIAAISTDAAKVDPIQAITELGTNLGLQEDEFLEPDKAFVLSTQNGDQQSLIAHWMIADDYYMYRDKFKFNLKQAPAGVSLGEVELPEGETKHDEYFGKIKVFHNAVTAQIPVIGDLKGEKVQIELVYQGCAEAGLCYPPIFKTVTYDPAGSSSVKDSAVTAAATTPSQVSTDSQSLGTDEKLIRLFKGDKLFTILVSLLGFGLLLAFTACMYPMIPIVSGIIVGHGEKVTAMKGFMLSLVYVLAMAVTFGIIGAIFGFTGEASNIAAQMQKPWVLLLFAALFVALALSMFGFYNIQMPSAIQSRLNEFSNKQKSGSLIGVSIMGVLSALIIGPCGGPILLATITGAAASNSAFLGFLYMFTLAIGMGLPLLLVGAGGGKLLPRAGGWMNTVKAVAGIVLLAVAIVFLERVVSSIIFMTLWALLFIVSATYMGAFEPIKEGSSGWLKLFKGLGLALFVYGVIVLIGGMTGARNFNDPLHGSELLARQPATMMTSSSAVQPAYVKFAQGKEYVVKGGLTFIKIKTVADFEAQLKSANAAGKTVMLDFYADWCTYCKQFDDYVFSDPKVQQALADTVLIQADITAQDKEDKAVLKHVDVITAPAILFFNTQGEEVRQQRVLGLLSAEKFLDRVNKAFN